MNSYHDLKKTLLMKDIDDQVGDIDVPDYIDLTDGSSNLHCQICDGKYNIIGQISYLSNLLQILIKFESLHRHCENRNDR
jgi:hypothetical protein